MDIILTIIASIMLLFGFLVICRVSDDEEEEEDEEVPVQDKTPQP